ncbi:hypothetical protein M0811_01605 [Anaeramoeba ignava]|uniref:DUF4139 domain-containing protein n=1 Tax=Anaeramoeba ignava TaxID=1746090 RepID=A0A9Q0LK16_ANAIG|nr:hypothetical protein M0811_01605 [Anaeramoeba ignava]
MKVQKIVLFKHGVGYFERMAEVENDAVLNLSFRKTEMDDVLKSLSVFDLKGGRISSVSYESTKPIDKQLEDISIHIPARNCLTGLLSQLKGTKIELAITSKKKVTGQVTGIQTHTRTEGNVSIDKIQITLLTTALKIASYDLDEIQSIKFLDDYIVEDLKHLLEILINSKKKDLKKLTIFARGEGKREILASYMPVWKTSYRIIFDKEKKAVIQGWALVDNTTEEDWKDVTLSLVSGLPVSFTHDLYNPIYKKRPEVKIEQEQAYAPPTLESNSMPRYSAQKSGMGRQADFYHHEELRSREKALTAIPQVQLRKSEAADLFSYDISVPVTVKRNQSALVSILQEPFEGKRVAVYNQEIRDKNPMSSLLFKNNLGLTLEGGPATIYEEENYLGEAMIDTMKPGDEKVIPFAVELSMNISIDNDSTTEDVHFAQISSGYLYLYYYQISHKIYNISNKGSKKVDLFLEHRFNKGWDLVDTPQPVEKTENFYRFRMDLEPNETKRFVVSEKGKQSQTHSLSSFDSNQVGIWISKKYIDDKTREVLMGFVNLREQIAELQTQISNAQNEVSEIENDHSRLRENLNALGESSTEKTLRQRYIKRLSTDEDRLNNLRAQLKDLRSKKDTLESDLRSRIYNLSFSTDVKVESEKK